LPKSKAPALTFAEPHYLAQLVEQQTPIEVTLVDGKKYSGVLEYWDTCFIRVTRDGKPNLFIYKHDIRYIAEIGR
jgi:host factor-I protein